MTAWSDAVRGSGLPRPRLTAAVVTASVAVAALVTPLSQPQSWVGWLPTTMSISETAAIWAPVLVSAVAAWVSGQARAHGMQEWAATSPRGAGPRTAPALLLIGVSAVVGQAVAVAVLLGVSLRYGLADGFREPDLLLTVPTVTAYLLVWVVAGTWLGRVVRREIALPLAAVLPYASYTVMVTLSYGRAATLTIADGGTFDYLRPATVALLLRVLFWVAVAIGAWALLLQRRRLARTVALTGAVVAALALIRGPVLVDIPGSQDPVCEGTTPVTCLDGAHVTVMGRYRTAVDQLWPTIPAALRPATISGLGPGVLPEEREPILDSPPVAGLEGLSRIVDATVFAARTGDVLFTGSCRLGSAGWSSADALVMWWRAKHDVPIDGSAFVGDGDSRLAPDYPARAAEATAFSALPQTDQTAWFEANADAVRNCTAPALASR